MADESNYLTIKQSGDVRIVHFADSKILNELSISAIGDELSTLVGEQARAKVLLSFKNVDHLSSAALGMLIKLNKEVSEGGGRLRLSDIAPQIFEVFKITRLNKMFDIHDTTEQALENF